MARQAESAMPDTRNNYINLSAWYSGIWQGSNPQSDTGLSQINFQLENKLGEQVNLLEQEFKLKIRAKTIPCGLITLIIAKTHSKLNIFTAIILFSPHKIVCLC